MAKRKAGEGTWGTKTIKGVKYHYYRDSKGNYTTAKTIKEVKEKLKDDIPKGTLEPVKLPKESKVAVPTKKVAYTSEEDMNILYEEAFKTVGKYNRYRYGDAARLICLIMYTGLRVSEACALKWENIDMQNKLIYITNTTSILVHLKKIKIRQLSYLTRYNHLPPHIHIAKKTAKQRINCIHHLCCLFYIHHFIKQ